MIKAINSRCAFYSWHLPGDEDTEVVAATVSEQPDQSTDDATEAVPTQDILKHGADSSTIDQSND